MLRLPAVADKTFLISIGDRTVGGMTARDQMIGPWQVPVADVAVTLMGYQTYLGEAFAVGERTPVALIDPAASARMAVGEAITNIAAALIGDIGEIKLSANWMAAAGHPGEDAALFDAVNAVGMELCPRLGISIPVGKDSMSMKTVWQSEPGDSGAGVRKEVTAPLSLIVSAFARVADARNTLTPQLRTDCGKTELILIDLGAGRSRLGGSALAQVYKQVGDVAPDITGLDGAADRAGSPSLPRPRPRDGVHRGGARPARDGRRLPVRHAPALRGQPPRDAARSPLQQQGRRVPRRHTRARLSVASRSPGRCIERPRSKAGSFPTSRISTRAWSCRRWGRVAARSSTGACASSATPTSGRASGDSTRLPLPRSAASRVRASIAPGSRGGRSGGTTTSGMSRRPAPIRAGRSRNERRPRCRA